MTDEDSRRGPPRLLVLAALLLACVGLEYWAHIRYGLAKVYPHLYYVPLLLAAVWWGLKGGLLVALFLSLLHVAAYLPGIDEAALSRAVVFACMGSAAGILSGRHKRVKEEREKLLHYMGERVKELTCIYEVTRSASEDKPLPGILADVAARIPPNWQYPEIARARVCLDGQEHVSEPFEEAAWRQSSGIVVRGERRGSVEVHYLEERPELDEGPFLSEERCLLDGIASTLGQLAERKEAEAALRKAHDELEERVEERTAELAAANQALVAENTERQRAEAEIHRLNEDLQRRVVELDALNAELASFSHSVSHDLRGPLRAAEGFSRALLDDCADALDEQGKHYVDRIRAGCQRMSELIEDLLRLSGVTAAEMSYETVDLSELAREVAAELRKSQPEREVEFAIPDGLVVEGDRPLLRILLEHLLGNAWKFASKHPTASIELGATTGGDGRVFFVRDDGAGFDMAYAHKLFAPFQRLHSQAEFPGTGIGLATVQRIVRRHGGRVWVEAAVEQGATFYFTL